MKRRDFVKLCALSCVYSPNLFASSSHTIYVAPAIPSILIAKAALNRSDSLVKVWKNPDELRVGVASNKFSVMMSPANVCSMLYNKGFDVGYLNFLTRSITSMMSKNKPINTLKDLEGKTLIMPFKNDMPDIVLRTLLKHNSVDISKIKFIYTSTPAEALALFLGKSEIDAGYLPEPMASAAKLKGKLKALNIYNGFNSYDLWKKTFNKEIYQAGMIANRKYYYENEEYFKSFHNDLSKAYEWVLANPNEAATIGENLLNAPKMAISEAIPNANLCLVKASDVKADVMEFLKIVNEYNPALIGNKLPSDEIFLQ